MATKKKVIADEVKQEPASTQVSGVPLLDFSNAIHWPLEELDSYAIFDTETTGLLKPGLPPSAQPKIIDIGLILVRKNVVIAQYEQLIHPGEEITEQITKITGITNDMLKGQPSFAEVLPTLEEMLLGVYGIIAHNMPFDMGMLTNELKRLGKEFRFPYPPKQICTVAAFEHLKGRRLKMTELYQLVLKRPLEQKHRALADAQALAEICIAEGICE